jgi:hypothetical protein
MTVLTKRLAGVAAGAIPSMGVFGPKRAGDRLAGSKGAWLEQSGLSVADPTRNADSSTTLWIWRFILASVGFVVLAVYSSGRPAVSGSSASVARASSR